TNSLDCNDTDNTVYPGAPELCDGKDNDCDGQIDEDGGVTWYQDSDNDGFGNANVSTVSCTQPTGYVTNSLDCDDADNTIYPGAPELCDGKDNDCDGQIDEDGGATWYQDLDNDGFGNANVSTVSCTQPTGYVTNSLDCDDADNTIYPGAPELCDGKDNDCNGLVDDNAGTYTITASANTGGSISPSGSVSVGCGDDQTFIMTADPGFVILDVLIDGVSNGAISSYTFNDVSTTHSIEAYFSAIGTNDYTIIATAGTGGGISPSGTSTVPQGSSITYTITADPCYAVSDVWVNGTSVGAVTSYSFNNVNANHTIEASFAYMPAPGPFTGIVNVCPFEGTPQELTYSVPDMPGVITYQWVVPPTVSLLSGQGTNSITLTIQNGFGASANKQLRVYAVWPCGNSDLSIFYLQAQAPTTPQPITASSDNVCESIGSGNVGITYAIPKVNAATSYTWTAPSGVLSVDHPNGPGENDTVVVITYGPAFTGGYVTVQASNNCGISGVRSRWVERNNPSTPGLINGPVNVCEYVGVSGTLAVYAVSSDPSVTEYTWSVPAGATDVSGQGTPQISFRYPAGYTGGSISVTAGNGCGVSNPRVLRVSTLRPGAPGGITVTETQACPNRQYTYSLAAMPSGSTSVLWTAPAGATIVSGQGTLSIVVQYPSSALAGTVTATGVNGCSSGNTRTLQVKLPECVASGDAPAYVKSAPTRHNLEVSVFPNPSRGAFHVATRTNLNEKMQVTITDIQGRKMSGTNLLPNQTHTLGADLKPGMYFIEIIQGDQRIIRKILKQ
ncbi:MAG TPA: MopE-related protein, partial [Ferruginibacter sp.]|nr:MopE-related protein [Ferruginibacter sp.]HRO18475.1 MopE-related protein [Ferruginibacter sp.]HRQ21699.1 MopE-related protein [Ferruginibacter sp.]